MFSMFSHLFDYHNSSDLIFYDTIGKKMSIGFIDQNIFLQMKLFWSYIWGLQYKVGLQDVGYLCSLVFISIKNVQNNDQMFR